MGEWQRISLALPFFQKKIIYLSNIKKGVVAATPII